MLRTKLEILEIELNQFLPSVADRCGIVFEPPWLSAPWPGFRSCPSGTTGQQRSTAYSPMISMPLISGFCVLISKSMSMVPSLASISLNSFTTAF